MRSVSRLRARGPADAGERVRRRRAAAAAASPQPPPADAAGSSSRPQNRSRNRSPTEPQKYEETVVVSASRTEEKLINAPATMTVIGPQTIQSAPTQNFAELLRAVPGVNITQVSARDINVTSRGATGTLATGTARAARRPQPLSGLLRLRDVGLPAGEPERDQADRSDPRAGVGGLGRQRAQRRRQRDHQVAARDAGDERHRSASAASIARRTTARQTGAGTLFYISGTHAQAVNDRWAFKLSAGGYTQDPLRAADRHHSLRSCPRSARRPQGPYPRLQQPGHDAAEVRRARRLRLRQTARSWSFSGGVAGTDGIMHTGIGPFDINSGSVMGYGKVNYTQQGLHAPGSSPTS